ncbi:unnamed protein product [Rhizopus stolonifer]
MITSPRPITISRSTRVLEELQDNLESTQKEVENFKLQLENARETKKQYEKTTLENVESNKKLRQDIHKVMQLLESKQQLLEDTKKIYNTNERKVKELKDQAMSARKKLESRDQKRQALIKERRLLENERQSWSQQQDQLAKSVIRQQTEFDQEIKADQDLLVSVLKEAERIRSLDLQKIIKQRLAQQVEERNQWISELKAVEEQMVQNTRAFVESAKKEIVRLLGSLVDDQMSEEIDSCTEALQALSVKIPHSLL